MKDQTVFDKCPVYESDRLRLRLVEPDDAEDLLCCYSDESAVGLMNSDNCSRDFYFRTLDEMADAIRGWVGAYESRWGEYKGGACIRFSIVDRQSSKAVGTVEMFDKTPDLGILRLDLCSTYENQGFLAELIELSTARFHDAFGVQHVVTKAIPHATERIAALRACGYGETVMPPGAICWTWMGGEKKRVPRNEPFGDYYMYTR